MLRFSYEKKASFLKNSLLGPFSSFIHVKTSVHPLSSFIWAFLTKFCITNVFFLQGFFISTFTTVKWVDCFWRFKVKSFSIKFKLEASLTRKTFVETTANHCKTLLSTVEHCQAPICTPPHRVPSHSTVIPQITPLKGSSISMPRGSCDNLHSSRDHAKDLSSKHTAPAHDKPVRVHLRARIRNM